MKNIRLIERRQLRHEAADWLQCALGGALWVLLAWAAVMLHAAVSRGVLQ